MLSLHDYLKFAQLLTENESNTDVIFYANVQYQLQIVSLLEVLGGLARTFILALYIYT